MVFLETSTLKDVVLSPFQGDPEAVALLGRETVKSSTKRSDPEHSWHLAKEINMMMEIKNFIFKRGGVSWRQLRTLVA
jgi:hypothetical protein